MQLPKLLLVLPLLAAVAFAGNAPPPKKEKVNYQKVAEDLAKQISDSSAKAEKTINKHMDSVSKDPGSLITGESMQRLMKDNVFLPQKAGTRTITLQGSQGFDGFSSYQPAGWKIVESMSGPTNEKPPPAKAKDPGFSYPAGLGPVLMNGCTEPSYTKSSPCFNSRLFTLQSVLCPEMIASAKYIGVGFDGRGMYSAESRKASLVQRKCLKKWKYYNQDVPDGMNVMGIHETKSEIRSFQSTDDYMKYIRHKAGQSNQKNLFASEASKYSKASSIGGNLGAVGAIAGGAVGAAAGGPAGAALGVTLGGSVGGAISGGYGEGSGKSSSKQSGSSKNSFTQEQQSNNKMASSQNFFAMMYVNVILYEITLDNVEPKDLTMSVLKDYMDLPTSYFSIGAAVKYQNFLLRWGTHFIRSGEFGGQLQITKTSKTKKIKSVDQFARVAETEFKSMFANLQSQYSQSSAGLKVLGIGAKQKTREQKDKAQSGGSYKSETKGKNELAEKFQQSSFTQTTVEAQGGKPEIAEAVVDFYTPAFKQVFHDWLVSIKDFPKPFDFQLKAINELFDMNMDSLFPAGAQDFGCFGGLNKTLKIFKEAGTGRRFYMDVRATEINGSVSEEKIKVYCRYSSVDEFKEDLSKRRISLERSIVVYMVEGPFPTASLDIPGGEPGCEETVHSRLTAAGNSHDIIKFEDMKKRPFLIVFDLPEDIDGVVLRQARFRIVYRVNRWFATNPKSKLMHLYDGCRLVGVSEKVKKICFQNIILTYEEKSGLFFVDAQDYLASKQRIPLLPPWLSGAAVARAKKLDTYREDDIVSLAARPCNVRWFNSHRLDPSKEVNCVHFTAASRGNIFVIFASVPRDHHTWYYLQISTKGVAFYHNMELRKQDVKRGMGVLGDMNLFQSFFVCLIQSDIEVTMQYGKADRDSEIGKVHSAYTFATHKSGASKLAFYTFGSGTEAVTLMDIRLTKLMPNVTCVGSEYEKVGSHCRLKCHQECVGCSAADDYKRCHSCKNLAAKYVVAKQTVTYCFSQCPVGYFQQEDTDKDCRPCPPGFKKGEVGNTHCTACKEGTFSEAGASECGPCPAGRFSNGSMCSVCSAGMYSLQGSSSCTPCKEGHFAPSGSGECSPCFPGHFANREGSSSCSPCPEDYASKGGQANCSKCPPGDRSPPLSTSCLSGCRKGQFSPSRDVKCQLCPPGSFAPEVAMQKCSLCPKGSYQPRNGSTECITAPNGTYVAEEGATSYRKCPIGSFSQGGASECQSCSDGSIAPVEGSWNCTLCRGFASNDSARCLPKLDEAECHQYKLKYADCSKLLDGNRSTNAAESKSCFEQQPPAGHSASVNVFFERRRSISRVVVWNRLDCCSNKVDDITVSVGTQQQQCHLSNSSIAATATNKKFTYLIFECSGKGEVVNVGAKRDVTLSLCEIEVYGI